MMTWTPQNEVDLLINADAAVTTVSQVVGENNAADSGIDKTTELTPDRKWYQYGETLLVIPQAASNPIIKYQLGTDEFVYELPTKRIEWEAGKAYIYDLSFNFYEIKINPTVVDWDVFPQSDL
jgi:hypothetical protein